MKRLSQETLALREVWRKAVIDPVRLEFNSVTSAKKWQFKLYAVRKGLINSQDAPQEALEGALKCSVKLREEGGIVTLTIGQDEELTGLLGQIGLAPQDLIHAPTTQEEAESLKASEEAMRALLLRDAPAPTLDKAAKYGARGG